MWKWNFYQRTELSLYSKNHIRINEKHIPTPKGKRAKVSLWKPYQILSYQVFTFVNEQTIQTKYKKDKSSSNKERKKTKRAMMEGLLKQVLQQR